MIKDEKWRLIKLKRVVLYEASKIYELFSLKCLTLWVFGADNNN